MSDRRPPLRRWPAPLILLVIAVTHGSLAQAQFTVTEDGSSWVLREADDPVLTYVFADPQISRPYLKDLHAPGGLKVTRNHPPTPGQDMPDHPTFHPGVWLAFGDLNGNDYWRLAASVERISGRYECQDDTAILHATYHYLASIGDTVVAVEDWQLRVSRVGVGYLLDWESTFHGEHELIFGDQEEMGLGIRLATPLSESTAKLPEAEPGTGRITDSEGRQTAASIWGQSARWVDYSGQLAEEPAGVALFCHPSNVRATRFHVRDYGLLTANLFATKAFGAESSEPIRVTRGSVLTLRYGLWIHGTTDAASPEIERIYGEYAARASAE